MGEKELKKHASNRDIQKKRLKETNCMHIECEASAVSYWLFFSVLLVLLRFKTFLSSVLTHAMRLCACALCLCVCVASYAEDDVDDDDDETSATK